ncbi:DUF4190 domain-containing protein [Brooklawnia sp.]|uniref:DUF4190 domain-containing protein n=1 Tax=Brooklawnia sp. TaxID=2699740 RepID=UPI00311ECA8B
MSSEGSWQHRDADPDAAFWSGEADRRADSGSDYNGYGHQAQALPAAARPPAEPPAPAAYPLAGTPQKPVQDRWSQPFDGSTRPPMVPYTNPGNYPRPDHPNATPSLALSIIGLFLPILSPIALAMSIRARKDIREHPGVYNEANNLTASTVVGAIGTAVLAVSVIFFVFVFAVAIFA